MTQERTRSARQRIGINIPRRPAPDAIDLIRRADAAGVETAWMTMTALGIDTPTLFAAAAVQTERITLGTSIVPAFTRHPLSLATQALALEQLAPGRFRLGIGTSHGPTMAGAYGLRFDQPLAQLREYLQILRPALHDGAVSFTGAAYQVEATLPATAPTPVLISALRENAFALAGELSDGAISWLCPIDYLLDRAQPSMQRAAETAGRATPPLVAHVIVAFDGSAGRDRAAIRDEARAIIAGYGKATFYARMFASAGYPLGPDGAPSDALIDQLVVSGDDNDVTAQLHDLLDRGLDELLIMPLPTPDPATEQRLIDLIGNLSEVVSRQSSVVSRE